MKNKSFFAGLLIVVLTIIFMAAGCATKGGSGTQKPEVRALGLSLDESLQRYIGPQQQTWGPDNDRFDVDVYFLDPLRFEEFRAELEAGGEYQQTDSWSNDNRDFDRGKDFARLAVRRDGGFELELYREDNSRSGYRYEKAASNKSRAAIGPKLDASLRKYIGPNLQDWGGEAVTVYFLDPLHFEEFRVELDAGVEYYQTDSWSDDNRDWDRGKDFARWAVRPDGSTELAFMRKDNSVSGYRYEKTADLAAKLGGEGKAVIDGSTIRLSGDVNLATRFNVPGGFTLEVPAGLTLDLTGTDANIELLNGATLTVNGTVNTGGHGDHGSGWVEGGLRIGEGAAIINGSGTINLKSKGSLLNIWGDKRHLTLDGVTLIGIKDNDSSLVQVREGGELILKSGAITGNTRVGNINSRGSGGVLVDTGTFIMEGGKISGNSVHTGSGGGVAIFSDHSTIFTMEGGEISGNSAISNKGWGTGGGVFVQGDDDIVFTMSGGIISNNSSSSGGGGVCLQNGATFTMSGGTISGNNAGDFGGGVAQQMGTFIMSGGTISGNSAKDNGGGVVIADGCNMIMEGGTISGNNASNGGGIFSVLAKNSLWKGTGCSFTMKGGRIQGNTDSDGFTKNTGANAAISLDSNITAKWGTGGVYTKGGAAQTGGSDIGSSDDTLVAAPVR
ncbi:hypothetical protein FACS189461_4900 [Spirochaetia bacterium]|nr:hypothetical protein FACS189461_4900 [Spirochaetia bacterium]